MPFSQGTPGPDDELDPAPQRVLVVDDDLEYRLMLEAILSPHFRVTSTGLGRSAIAIALSDPPDLVLLDINMPDMNGYDVLAEMRRHDAMQDMPVILVTGIRGTEEETRGFERGAVDYVTKPFRAPVVLARVKTHLELAAARRRLSTVNGKLRRVVGDLTAYSHTVSHDLRAPLRVIGGYLEMVRESSGAEMTKKSLQYLDRALQQASRMQQMINDVLEYSACEQWPLQLQYANLRTMALEVSEELKPVDVPVTIDVGDLPIVFADRAMLRQVLANLVSNAIRFASQAQEPRVTISSRRNGDAVEIVVNDNGPGFNAAQRHRLFKLFSRLHASADHAGSGVGLATVKRLVERHGGSVDADSEPGRPTSFSFTLPKLD